MRTAGIIVGAVVGLAGSAFGQEFLIVPDSSNDILNTFDPFDGSLVQTGFADVGSLGKGGSTPKDAIQVGSEIWVSDQLRDTIYRFDLGGSFVSSISGGLDNIRGMEFAMDTVYVSNSGDNNGAPGDAVVTFDADGNNTGFFETGGDPFDVLNFGNGLVINDIGEDRLDTFTYGGDFIANLVDSDGVSSIDFPQQMSFNDAGNILVGGFSSPAGVYEFTTDGDTVNYYDVGGIRGVYELGNGNIMFTDSDGVHVLDPDSGGVFDVYTDGSSQYINLVIPAPASAGLLGLASVAAFRRRR